MLKVLLVDDEEDVRQSIVDKLDWAGLGFAVAGQASNGQEALEMAELLEPDVIMTDIKMPLHQVQGSPVKSASEANF